MLSSRPVGHSVPAVTEPGDIQPYAYLTAELLEEGL
jgi:hypothetical protein